MTWKKKRPAGVLVSMLSVSLLDNLKTQYGPKPGFPKRFFGFDGTNAADDTLSEFSFVASTLSDLWLFYNQG
ncbi:hypothetical protein [Klebsiella quasipneumoniae]|uniref:hypothetical protein n=1 Tax=Klebsiella quasipneumoniae TaxID=1463165 RepID=UPI00352AD485